jgi:hypothetical protein
MNLIKRLILKSSLGKGCTEGLRHLHGNLEYSSKMAAKVDSALV